MTEAEMAFSWIVTQCERMRHGEAPHPATGDEWRADYAAVFKALGVAAKVLSGDGPSVTMQAIQHSEAILGERGRANGTS